MKKYQCLFFVVCILAIYSCQKFDGVKTENENNTDIANIAMLSFSSEEDFIAALNQKMMMLQHAHVLQLKHKEY